MKKLFAVAAAVVVFSSTAFCAVSTDGTQTRNSASERVPLISLVMPALQQIRYNTPLASVCINMMSSPVIDISGVEISFGNSAVRGGKVSGQMIVSMTGETHDFGLNDELSRQTGQIIGCLEAVSQHSEEVAETFRKLRPSRAQAIEVIKDLFEKTLADDYENFKEATPGAYKIKTYVTAGNGGFAQPDLTWQSSPTMLNKVEMKGNQFHSFNGVPAREVIVKGVYSFFTNPERVDTMCSVNVKPAAPKGKAKAKPGIPAPATKQTFPCIETYQVKFENGIVDVHKNGQRWFDHEFIGGAIYAIELSGEKSNSTTKKVER